jgi:tRNA pseudouridine13 synthase
MLYTLTAGIPGTGGRIKVEPADFTVEEVPAYEPSGSGDHLYLWLEKTGVSSEALVRELARRINVPPRDIGTAGRKDRHAVTRQWVSVPKIAEPLLPRIDGDGVRILNVSRHNNKLRIGHLKGNHFSILVRDADPARAADAEHSLAMIRDNGLPNYYGPQRFGHDGRNAELGLKLLAGERLCVPPPRLQLYASAAQSYLFNHYLSKRLADGLFRTVLPGDVLMKYPAGGLFVSSDAAVDQPRLDAREVVPGGPMFGAKTFAAGASAAERENETLEHYQLSHEQFVRREKLFPGTRRHAIVYPTDLQAAWEPAGLRLQFFLPAGSYATVLVAEITKTESKAHDEPDADT